MILMFMSNRFTKAVTRLTHERLLAAQSNERPIERGETHRGSVVSIQEALNALNESYVPGSGIDGYFGRYTFAGVDAFQREYGLVADGIVGKQTLTQLDTLFSGDNVREPVGISIHLGLDRVDPGHYGSDLALPSCANDARAMAQLADALGYDTAVLVDEAATTTALYDLVGHAATSMQSGDALFITISSHGSQIPNTSGDLETDMLDETLCLFDRMLVDDELTAMLGNMPSGVRVHVVFDSCHSGTAFKSVLDVVDSPSIAKEYAKSIKSLLISSGSPTMDGISVEDVTPITSASLDAAVEGEAPKLVKTVPSEAETVDEVSTLFADLYISTSVGKAKFTAGEQVYQQSKQLYNSVRSVTSTMPKDAPLACTATTLSACADHQETPAGNPLSAFTFELTSVWANGSFLGSYDDLNLALRGRARPDATPQLNSYGSRGAAARTVERPFAF